MLNKNIAFVFAMICCSSSYAILDNQDDHHHHTKTDDRKLEILKKELEELTDTEKKLILNEKHMSTTKICFWTALGSAGVAAAAVVLLKNETKSNVMQAATIMGVAASVLGIGSSVNQGFVLHNINDQKKQTLNAMNNIK